MCIIVLIDIEAIFSCANGSMRSYLESGSQIKKFMSLCAS